MPARPTGRKSLQQVANAIADPLIRPPICPGTTSVFVPLPMPAVRWHKRRADRSNQVG